MRLGSPGELKINFARLRLEPDQTAAREIETPASAIDGGEDRTGIRGKFIRDFVNHFARELIEGHDSRSVSLGLAKIFRSKPLRAAANGDDEQIPLHDRHTANAKEVLVNMKRLLRAEAPNLLTIFNLDADQHSLWTKDVDAIVIDDRTGTWSGRVAVQIVVGCGEFVFPEQLARLGISAGEPTIVAKTVEVEETAPAGHGGCVAKTHRCFPHNVEPFAWPLGENASFGRDVVGSRPEKHRPIGTGLASAKVGRKFRACDRTEQAKQAERTHKGSLLDELSAIDIDGTDIQFGVANQQVGSLANGDAPDVGVHASDSSRG